MNRRNIIMGTIAAALAPAGATLATADTDREGVKRGLAKALAAADMDDPWGETLRVATLALILRQDSDVRLLAEQLCAEGRPVDEIVAACDELRLRGES